MLELNEIDDMLVVDDLSGIQFLMMVDC